MPWVESAGALQRQLWTLRPQERSRPLFLGAWLERGGVCRRARESFSGWERFLSCLCGAIKHPKRETLEDVLERWQMKTWVCISSRRFRRYLAWAREGRYLLYKGRVNVWVEMYMGLFDRVIMPYVDGVHARSPSSVYKDYLLHFLSFFFF